MSKHLWFEISFAFSLVVLSFLATIGVLEIYKHDGSSWLLLIPVFGYIAGGTMCGNGLRKLFQFEKI